MGLRETFKAAAQTAIAAVGNVAVSTNYSSFSSSTYNASAGTNTVTYSSTSGVSVVFDKFEIAEIDGVAVRPEDKLAHIAAKDISGVTPKATDKITHASGTWEVVNVMTDPAEALWLLQVRKP